MKQNRAFAAGMVAIASAAYGDTVTARFTADYSRTIDITYVGDREESQRTVLFRWTRQDSPGPGVDSTLPVHFTGYCVELAQSVSANTNHVYQVLTPAEAGYNPVQALLLSRLWATYLPGVDTDNESGAFQMAVWELTFDGGVIDLSAGNFQGHGPSAVRNLASAWLSDISSVGYAGGTAPLRILHNDRVQDMLVPTPGSLALLGLGGALMRRRKR